MDGPPVGTGTARFDSNDRCRLAVEFTLDVGYRRVDTGRMYGTEGAVGEAVAAADVDRDEVFVTTKLDDWNRDHDALVESSRESPDALRVDTGDVLSVHSPNSTGRTVVPTRLQPSRSPPFTPTPMALTLRELGFPTSVERPREYTTTGPVLPARSSPHERCAGGRGERRVFSRSLTAIP